MKKIFGFKSNFFSSVSTVGNYIDFPTWNGSDATNYSLIQEAYDSRLSDEQAATSEQYYTISIPSADYYAGCLAPNGCIYFLPINTEKRVLKFDTATETYELIGDVLSANYGGCVLAEDGCIYSAPYTSGGNYLKIDTNTDTVTVLGVASGSARNWSSVLSPNNIIYHGKTTNENVAFGEKFSIETQTESTYGPVPRIYPYAMHYMRESPGGAVLCANNIIYQSGIRYSYQLLAINPETGSVYAQGNVGNSGTWWSSRRICLLGSYGNKLFLRVDGSTFRIYDVTNNNYQTLSFPTSTETMISRVASNGCVYFLANNVNGYIKLNTLTNEITTISTPNQMMSSTTQNIIFAPNGRLYHAHGDKIHALNITNKPYPIDFCLSRYINHN